MESTASVLARLCEGLGIVILPALVKLKLDTTAYIRAVQTFQIASVVVLYNFKIPANALVYLDWLQTLGRMEFISIERFKQWLPMAVDDDDLLTPSKAGYKTTSFWYNAHAYLLGLAVLHSIKAISWLLCRQHLPKIDSVKAFWQTFTFRYLVVAFTLSVQSPLQVAAGLLVIGSILKNRDHANNIKFYHMQMLFVVLVPASFVKSTSSKLLAITIINLAATKKLFSGNPENTRSQTRMERTNLIFAFSLGYILLCFTDLVQDPASQYFMGEVYIAYLGLIAITNISFLVWAVLRKLEGLRRKKHMEESFRVAYN